jgi:hypothetical protein
MIKVKRLSAWVAISKLTRKIHFDLSTFLLIHFLSLIFFKFNFDIQIYYFYFVVSSLIEERETCQILIVDKESFI